MKTFEEWVNESNLSEEEKQKCFDAQPINYRNAKWRTYSSLKQAIILHLDWHRSKDGWVYWDQLFNNLTK